MPDLASHDACTGCLACFNACPKSAIYINTDEQGFTYPSVNVESCINCHLCEKTCPVITPQENTNEKTPITLAAWHPDDGIREKSSSGGAFSCFASYALNNSGVVYGAAWTNNGHVETTRVTTHEKLDSIRRSKYVSGSTGLSLKLALKDAEEKTVVFSGTPCQIAGLKALMSTIGKNKNYNLLTVDFICHGVPSPRLFNSWKKSIEDKFGDEISDVNFRDKRYGVETNLVIIVKFKELGEKILTQNDISFYQAFINNLCLRPSCYQCIFNKIPRIADVSLSDYRGLGNKIPFKQENERPKGFTGVMLNNAKAHDWLNKTDLQYAERPFEELKSTQENLTRPTPKPQSYNSFWKAYNEQGYNYAIKHYAPFTWKKWCEVTLRRILTPKGFYFLGRVIGKITGRRKTPIILSH